MLRSGWKKMNEKIRYVGPNFFELLTLIFIILKLLGKIDWSWWWVLAPLWLGIGIICIIAIIVAIVEIKKDGY